MSGELGARHFAAGSGTGPVTLPDALDSLVQAMETAADSLGTPLLQRAVEAAGKSVREGQPLSASLKQSKIFPPLA